VVATNTNPYNIFSAAAQRNHSLYDHMRSEDPVHAAVHPQTGHTVWFLTRYDDCLDFLKDKRFGKEFRSRLPAHLAAKAAEDFAEDGINQHMLNLDDPAHARLKALVHVAFTPQRIGRWRPRLEAIAHDLFDQMDRSAAAGDEIDLTQHYIGQLPLLSIADMLGIPAEDYYDFHTWTHAMLSGHDTIVRPALAHLTDYLARHIDARRLNPAQNDDLVASLMLAEDAGDSLSRQELLAMVFLLITAGYETMVNFISNGIVTLFEHPDALRQLQDNVDDGVMVRSAIEEMLRFSGPSHMTLASWAFEDVEIGDRLIPQGDTVHAVLLAANRDPEVFDDPHRFDITRSPNRHIAFSYGIHHCLGAALARLEGEVAFTTLLRRIPNL
jgi:cytochrome P450 PksS